MGEAKRKQAAGLQLAEALDRRLAAGEFGAPGAERFLLVLDKSAPGRELLAVLRAFTGLPGLSALLQAEPLRLWGTSKLFTFAMLVGGAGTPEQRTFLAPDLDRLLEHGLPRAWRRVAAGAPVGFVCGVSAESEPALQAALRALCAAGPGEARR